MYGNRKRQDTLSKQHLRKLVAQESKIVSDFLLCETSSSCDNMDNICTIHLNNDCATNSNIIGNDHNIDNAKNNNKNTDMFEQCENDDTLEQWNEYSSSHSQSSVSDNEQDNVICKNRNTESTVPHDLAVWAVEHQVTHTTLRALLKILKKHPCFETLPLDARTLLQTPRQQVIRTVLPGSYYHFGLSNSLRKILAFVENNINIIQITVNIDGLPLSKSSQRQFWPILGSVLPYNYVFVIGIYHGFEKPVNANNFLQDFVEEAEELCANGINVNGENIPCRIEALICDAPAKSFVLCVKGHSGYSSCTKCTTEGEHVGRMCFPEINAPLRSDDDFIQKVDDSYHKPDITCSLLNIPHFKPVSNVPLDYMHLILLGIVRKLLYSWLGGELRYYRLQHRAVDEISLRLIQLKPFIPVEFARKPRHLNCIKLWKATEYRLLLLYTGPLAFKSLIKKNVYVHFMTLHVIMRILSSEDLHEYLNYAQDLIEFFIKTFIKLYGVENISHNVHGLVHLVNDVRKFGPVDNFSAFKFENYLQILKKYLRKADKPLEQLVRRYTEKELIISSLPNFNQIYPTLTSLHYDGPLLLNCHNPQYKIVKFNGFTLKAGTIADNCCSLSCGTIVCIENVAHCTIRNIPVIIGYEFLERKDLFHIPCPSSKLGIYSVGLRSDLKSWPLRNIVKKYVQLPYENDEHAIFPLIHSKM